jgi:hypothetical protein
VSARGVALLAALLGAPACAGSPAPERVPPDGSQAAGGEGALAFSRTFGTDGADFARAIAADVEGNTFVSGYTDGTFGGADSSGTWDAFLTRLDASGEPSWSRQWDGSGPDFAQAVLQGADGEVFIAGYGQGPQGGHDAFLTRYDRDGASVWQRQWGSAEDEYVYAAAGDEGGVVVAGYTEGALGGVDNAGAADVFVTRHDPGGDWLWTTQWGTEATDYGQAVHVTGAGEVLVAGYTAGKLGDEQLGAEDAFLAKLDSGGELLWLRQWGSATTDYGLSLASDADGNVYVTGYTYGSIAEDVALGREDAFLSKFDALGTLLWSRQWGSAGSDGARSLALAANGDVLVAGDTEGSFDGYLSNGGRDAFLTRYSAEGEQLWSAQWGSASEEFSLSVAAAGDAVFVAGYLETDSLQRDVLLSRWEF